MSILSFNFVSTGQVGNSPRIVQINSNDSFDTVIAPGYLNLLKQQGFYVFPNDIVALTYGDNISELFSVSIESGVITLLPLSSAIVGYATASHAGSDVQLTNPLAAITDVVVTTPSKIILPNFTEVSAPKPGQSFLIRNATGSDGGTLYKNDGVTAVTSFTQSNQYAILYVTDNSTANGTFIASNFLNNAIIPSVVVPTTSGNIVQFNDTAGTMASGPVAANKVLTSAITTPDVGVNLITFNITVGQAALASGGSVTLVTSSGSKQYKILSLFLNSGGTNFSGGSGNRLGQVTDGTTVYTLIPAATMQSLVNGGWGITTTVPFPAAAAINTSTVAGANLTFKYSGGTTDYTAGSLVMTGIVQRVA